MSYLPLFDHDINTAETPTGETVERKLVYRKLIKQSGNLSLGSNTVAHGATFVKLVRLSATIERSDGSTISIPWNDKFTGSGFHIAAYVDATNINLDLGSAWTGAGNVLSDAWLLFEYTK